MKIRHPWMIRLLGWVGAWVIRVWMGTLRLRYRALGPNIEPRRMNSAGYFIAAFWHENILLPASLWGRPEVLVLISQHADGQLIAEVCRHLGFGLVRGSTTRGSIEAVRRMLRAEGSAWLAITPDGPRGPRRQVQLGMIYLAARTGMPILLVGCGFQRPWRLRSWDHFVLPRPFTRAVCVTGEFITVPTDADRDQLEQYRRRVEERLQQLNTLAEHWAEQGIWPDDAAGASPDERPKEQAA